jgi:subtilisin family serine protease
MVTRLRLSVFVLISMLAFAAFAQEDGISEVVLSEQDAALAAAARIGGTVSIGIELADEPSAVVYQKALKNGHGKASANAEAKKQLGRIKAAQQKVLNALKKEADAKVFFQTQRTFNGFGAFVKADKLDRIRAIEGVASVHVLVPHERSNAGSVPFIGAPGAWVAGGGANAGQGMSIAVIDTGVDYIHTNFGGPGAGYAANNTTAIGDTPGVFPGPKVAGGWDFAGDNYDASTAALSTPAPDPDPMDCNGHGSHVAGSAAGFGVNPDGSTYTGPYDLTTPFGTMKIGPGVAPAAKVYALRVFGCGGTTLLTTAAIEWAVDPNDDGDFSDHVDVINMSLGAAFGSSFDASAVAAENAALAGVLVVVAAGNNGDTHYTVGAPGSAARAITVAASQDNGFPALRVNGPSSIAGFKAIGKPTAWGVQLTDPGVTGQVVAAIPQDACTPITNAAALSGKIAFIDRGGVATCVGFEGKALAAQNAGAIGVIIGNVATSATPLIPPGMATGNLGGVVIPAVSLGLNEANQIRANLAAGVNVTIARSLTGVLSPVGDLVASFSSRGIRRGDNLLKPDISAPGVAIHSTAVGSGNDAFDNNGTSMATPHMAGAMAVLKQLHPDWTVEELKALAMNTAAHDLFLSQSQIPPNYNVARQGAGRANLTSASSAAVIAMNDAGDGAVGVSFGAIEVFGSHTSTKTVKVVNKGAVTETYSVSIQNTQSVPGVSYSLPDGNSVTVAPGETATLRVQLSATAAAMKHSLDSTMSVTQTPAGGGALARVYLSEQSGYVVLTPSAGPKLRVPVHAIVRPASAMSTVQSGLLLAGASGTNTLTLTGTQVNSGATAIDDRSVVSVLELAGTSPNITASAGSTRRAADLKAVGVTASSTNVYFGLATHGKWTTLLDIEFDVYIDRNRDGVYETVFFTTTLFSGVNRLDLHGTSVINAGGGLVTGSVFSFVNGVGHATSTIPFNSNVLMMTARLADLGITAATGRFNYRVDTFARGTSGMVDSFSGSYDPFNKGLNIAAASAPIFFDFNGTNLSIPYNTANFNANGSQGVLLLHHYNADGARDQIVPAAAPAATTTTVAAAAGQYSDVVTLSATVSPAVVAGQAVTGVVNFTVNGVAAGSAPVNASGSASLSHTISNAAGSYAIGATFVSSSAFHLGSSGASTLSVAVENATVTASNGNPGSVQVASAGGNGSFSLSANIVEVADGSLGNIALAQPVTVTLTPVGPGSSISQVATGSVAAGVLTATASFTNVPVNVYDVTFTIGGAHYTGSGSSIVAVFDPSLGDLTGGGWIVRDGVRANFGFNVKYQKNGNAQGQILFIEHRPSGNVKVKSNNLGTLSIAGDTAIILGKAVIDGTGNWQFRLTAIDNGEPGSSDALGLQVTGDASLTFAPVTLSGGNIQVP